MTTASFIPTTAQATAAGYYPPRRTVEVTGVRQLAQGVFRLTFRDAFIAEHAKPAQFVNLYSHNPLHMSPRPFGVADVHGDEVAVIFAVVGYGTDEFSRMQAGDRIDVLGPLGKSYDVGADAHYVLVGGGLGIPPLLRAAQVLSAREDATVTTVFGYRNEHFADEFVAPFADRALAIDESEGNVITLLERIEHELRTGQRPVTILSCGPLQMLKAVSSWAANRDIACQFSLEERMGCGYGTCVVCVVDTVDGRQKVCVDGPVFTPEQLGWTE
ncbi:2-polyprenylphenol hydroxylase [Bifidobacterium cuniculi]|uniref:Dihydroorotate dehydrogenase electron transfer subunit n=1 Tax=Bifidobacterium cuniculi TaxID=1688 RepID=A0A087B4N5_9BIFI|nr:2-polyprenylphenol hydroxylase [Bifidobacterium cuniculi]KFI65985.1 dihydroorotate dehydrogenase electron transfer subunit [Bifidobacterium cuniculi]